MKISSGKRTNPWGKKYASKSIYMIRKFLWTPNNISKFKKFSGPMDVAAMTQSRIKLLTKMADKHGKCSSHLFTNPKFSFLREEIVFSKTNNLFWFLTHNIWEIVCPVKMEHVCKINIFAIKMMMKSHWIEFPPCASHFLLNWFTS
jgi:hypothetical protein